MASPLCILMASLDSRRRELRMSFSALALRSSVSEPTIKRMFSDQRAAASFANVASVARALGMTISFDATDPDDFRRQQALRKAEKVAEFVQGASMLEDQAVDSVAYNRLVERSNHELLAGSPRRLWAE